VKVVIMESEGSSEATFFAVLLFRKVVIEGVRIGALLCLLPLIVV